MRIPLLILLVSLTITARISVAQSTPYFEWIHQADSLTNRKEYKKAAAFYDKALPQANRKYITYDWYNAVCIYALAGENDYRRPLDTVIQKYGANSPQVDSLEDNMAKADSLNLILVRSILDKYGWLGPDIIGGNGSSTLFAVIQHADLAPGVQEKYLPYLRRAVEKGDADPSDLALLEDRILVGQHKPQLYGSQIKTNDQGVSAPFPIADSSHVDSRRAKMGLGPLKYYVQLFNPTPTAQ
jgi:hypothetical protein